ncbi:fructokinase [Streptomyces sp. SLBN-118]|uniref:carbohydrate kinase family protein n=1 Tax=Streptomyces sp. SLBN-118 TaxID=2768454 RepID=UPI00115051A4|nr:carbohydrate kinase [Streptomyces sp. SLBN-118]TQK50741.1 fructokinase [Streptomyces sp. SLBN-118]
MSSIPKPADQPAVIVAGDALVDLTPARTANGDAAYQPRPGGSCLNVAAGLGRLSVPAALLARLSDDHFGDLLRRHLAESGTHLTHVLRTPDPTTLAAVHLGDDMSAVYSFHANGTADRGLQPTHLAALPDDGRLPEAAALHVGSLGLLLEPLASTLDGLLRRESGRRLVSLDPNVRPGLVTDRAAYLRRFTDWVALADVVKASEEDLAWLHPGEPYEAVADRWLASGAGLVLITLGSRGAWAAGRTACVHVPAPAVEVVDTVGAGDAFTAGALAYLHRTSRLSRGGVAGLTAEELERLLAYAVEIAADTCTRAGAQPPYRRNSAPVLT